MDIASLSMAMSHSNVSTTVSTAVLAKSLDNLESNGKAMAEMLSECADPNRGQSIDVRI